MKKVAVVIPFYKGSLTAYEKIALQQCRTVLSHYPVIAVKPNGLELPGEAGDGFFTDVIGFEDKFFAGIAGYNELMLSADFYAQFLAYEYILIYQPDAFVFKDELAYWCGQEYDYIGAPWIRRPAADGVVKKALLKVQQLVSTAFNLKKHGLPNKYQFENKVGNGGLSLRRVVKFYEVCISMQQEIQHYLSHTASQYNEDAFWSIQVNRKQKALNIPSWQTGLKFAFETYPGQAYRLNNRQLPFGCHDWDRYPDFWRPIFKDHNYDI